MRLWITIYLAIALALQLAFGNIDDRLFTFPVGAALGGGALAILYVAEKEWGKSRWIKDMRSSKMACLLIALSVFACIIGGCMSANSSFQSSIPFVALLVALMVNLTLAILHRIITRHKKTDWIFIATHVGIWLMLFCGLAGSGDNRSLRAVVSANCDTTLAIDANSHTVSLPYTLRLLNFNIETNAANGSPTQYEATILIDNKPVEIAVNNPHSFNMSDDLYLMNFLRQADGIYCVFMIEHQPWKYPMLTGIVLLLIGAVAGGVKRAKPHISERIKDIDNTISTTRV